MAKLARARVSGSRRSCETTRMMCRVWCRCGRGEGGMLQHAQTACSRPQQPAVHRLLPGPTAPRGPPFADHTDAGLSEWSARCASAVRPERRRLPKGCRLGAFGTQPNAHAHCVALAPPIQYETVHTRACGSWPADSQGAGGGLHSAPCKRRRSAPLAQLEQPCRLSSASTWCGTGGPSHLITKNTFCLGARAPTPPPAGGTPAAPAPLARRGRCAAATAAASYP